MAGSHGIMKPHRERKDGFMEQSTSTNVVSWEDRIRDFRSSGKSITQWCRENHIVAHQLRYRLQKEQRTMSNKTGPTWLSIPPSTVQKSSSSSGVSLRIGAVEVLVEREFDDDVLANVIRSLLSEC